MRRRLIITLLVSMLCYTAPALANSPQPLRIAYTPFEPFHATDPQGHLTGLFYDMLTEALQNRLKTPLVWTPYPWPRCQENVKNGLDDALLTVPTAQRAAFTVTHADPFYIKSLTVFTYARHPRIAAIRAIRTIADIRRAGFSTITYSGNGWQQENVRKAGIKVVEAFQLENVWKMLAQKRGDLVIEWPLGVWPILYRNGLLDRVVDTGIEVAQLPFHLLLRQTASQVVLLPALNATFKAMQQDGTMASIVSKYDSAR